MSKRLIARSKLSNRQLNQLVDFFALEFPAVKAARVLRINRHSTASGFIPSGLYRVQTVSPKAWRLVHNLVRLDTESQKGPPRSPCGRSPSQALLFPGSTPGLLPRA